MSPFICNTNGVRISYKRDRESPFTLAYTYSKTPRKVRCKVFTTADEAMEFYNQIVSEGRWPISEPPMYHQKLFQQAEAELSAQCQQN